MDVDTIYTHDEAALIVELFEDVLDRYHVTVPSPEDDEREAGSTAALYASTYSGLLDSVERQLIHILDRHIAGAMIVQDKFSGAV